LDAKKWKLFTLRPFFSAGAEEEYRDFGRDEDIWKDINLTSTPILYLKPAPKVNDSGGNVYKKGRAISVSCLYCSAIRC
jgi:hypothetical protein